MTLFSHLINAAPEICLEAFEEDNCRTIGSSRNMLEQLIHFDADFLKKLLSVKDSAKNTVQGKKSKTTHARLKIIKLNQSISIFQQGNKNIKTWLYFIDILLDHRLNKNLDDYDALVASISAPLDFDVNEQIRSTILELVSNCYKVVMHYGYRKSYIDSAIINSLRLLSDIISSDTIYKYNNFTEQYLNKEKDKEIHNSSKDNFNYYFKYINQWLGELKEYSSYFTTFERLCIIKRLPLIDIKIKNRPATQSPECPATFKAENTGIDSAVTLPTTTVAPDSCPPKENERPQTLPQADVENTDRASATIVSNTTTAPEQPENECLQALIQTDGAEDVVEINGYAKNKRWWLGRKLEQKRNSQQKSKDVATKLHKKIILSEEQKIEIILKKYENFARYDSLQTIIAPQKNNFIKELRMKDFSAFLTSLGAKINESASGSRIQVSLNGLKTCFHSHGVIGPNTIKKHLRPFLIAALSEK